VVGLTAIEVSLCRLGSQSVLTLAAVEVGVVQIAVPDVVCPFPLPNTPPVTGAGASTALCVKSTGWVSSPPSAAAGAEKSSGIVVATAAARTRARGRLIMRRISSPLWSAVRTASGE
jgi:hypothetical protein